MPIKVYGMAMSTCTQRVLTTLVEKGLKYELVNVDFAAGEHKVTIKILLLKKNIILILIFM
jgi:hypothetical protein